jgi:hypothetical protein
MLVLFMQAKPLWLQLWEAVQSMAVGGGANVDGLTQ